jgi:type IV secretion system protein VirB11
MRVATDTMDNTAGDAGYYLDTFLAPLAPWLSRADVTDLWINRPGEVWVETLGGGIERHDERALDEALLGRLARQIAAGSSQGISRAQPLLAANLADGSRVQVVGPPATRAGHVFAVRKHVSSELSLADWEAEGAFDGLGGAELLLAEDEDYVPVASQEAGNVLREAVTGRRNILIAGGTSTGKTTFLNSLLAEIPRGERLILIEDTQELNLVHANAVGLIAARGGLAEAKVTAEDLLIAALRMRPDRIILGELRGAEAFTFLRAVNTGHPGSMTTIHADTPRRAIEQLVLLVLQSGTRLSREDVRHYVRESVDVFVQLARVEGRRQVSQVMMRRPG